MAKSVNQSPKKVLLTLLQSHLPELVTQIWNDPSLDELDEQLPQFIYFSRPRLATDPTPAIHTFYEEIVTDQRGIGEAKGTYDDIKLKVIVYYDETDLDWQLHQTIKQIIVENNQVLSVDDGDNSFARSDGGKLFESARVETTRFEVIYDADGEAFNTFYFVMDVVVKLQESYYT